MNKKKLSILFICILIVSLLISACGSNSSTGTKAGTDTTSGSKVNYPTGPIKIIVPYAPGGGTDVMARVFAGSVTKYFPANTKVVVENKTGGSGNIGTMEIINAKPDGHTLGLITTSPIAINTHRGDTPFKPSDLVPVIQFASVPSVLVVKADAPWKTFEEWVKYVKQNPKVFTYSTSGAGGITHLKMEAINLALGTETKHVPFDGNGPAVTALLGGHVMGSSIETITAKPYIDSGNMRALAVAGNYKPKGFENLPLLTEQGINTSIDSFFGIAVQKNTPEKIKTIIHDAFKKAMEDPEVVKQFEKLSTELVYANAKDFQKNIDNSYQIAGDVMESLGLIKK